MIAASTAKHLRVALWSIAVVFLAGANSKGFAQEFTYEPPGALQPGSGTGRVDHTNYGPGIRFPLEEGPAFANSQVWRHGGNKGPGGSQCNAANYSYPWRDNFCETRNTTKWATPLCPKNSYGQHAGQDIRPRTCADRVHWAVACVDGTISSIGTYSVYLTGDDGRRYTYLHMENLVIKKGQRVTVGQRLGKVSNRTQNGGHETTFHLHWEIRANVAGIGLTFVPTYLALVESYKRLLGAGREDDFSATLLAQGKEDLSIAPGQVASTWVEYRNTGHQPWEPGKTFLGTTGPRDGDSP